MSDWSVLLIRFLSLSSAAQGALGGESSTTSLELNSAELLTLLWRAQENNFKAVLESIRDLMNEETVLPEWLHDIFLGYGDPAAAQYSKLPNTLRTLDFKVHCLHTSL